MFSVYMDMKYISGAFDTITKLCNISVDVTGGEE